MSQPRERPILMSAPMVRSILAGTKTQTRRIVKYEVTGPNHPNTLDFRLPGTPPANGKLSRVRGWQGALDATTRKGNAMNLCPYGAPGERLWVRETCALNSHGERAYYRADCQQRGKDWILPMGEGAEICIGRWTPAIHMPRWASRITLEITDVRVERLCQISDADCFAEGIQQVTDEGLQSDGTARGTYRALWELINGAGSWELNPWVWAISFRRIGDGT